jgi:hypothetical protein
VCISARQGERIPQQLENVDADLVAISKWPADCFGTVRSGSSHSTDFRRSPISPASELHFGGAGAMTTDAFTARSQALEDEFFRRVDKDLARKLRNKWQHEHDIESLQQESRIDDVSIVEELLDAGIQPGMLRAMALVPAIHVAWANGFVESPEREAVLHAAHMLSISKDSPTEQLLVSWLDKHPSPELCQVWEDYIKALNDILNTVAFSHPHQIAINTAQNIAETAGGFLGVHSVSIAEQRAIQQVDEAFLR